VRFIFFSDPTECLEPLAVGFSIIVALLAGLGALALYEVSDENTIVSAMRGKTACRPCEPACKWKPRCANCAGGIPGN